MGDIISQDFDIPPFAPNSTPQQGSLEDSAIAVQAIQTQLSDYLDELRTELETKLQALSDRISTLEP